MKRPSTRKKARHPAPLERTGDQPDFTPEEQALAVAALDRLTSTQTHAALTEHDRKGFVSECPGELGHHGVYTDLTLDKTLTVTIWICRLCGACIAADSDGVRNVYHRDPS